MLVLTTGSRSFDNDYHAAQRMLARIDRLPRGTTVMHGGAGGADRYVGLYCAARDDLSVTVVPARWRWHEDCRCRDKTAGSTCRYAGIRRNLQMLDRQPDQVIAFWNGHSPGTKHVIDEARRRGIPVEVILT